MPKTAPLPITQDVVFEGDSEAFIPYPPIGERLEHVPINVRPEVHYYISRMAFLPNTIKLYLHNPWSAEHLHPAQQRGDAQRAGLAQRGVQVPPRLHREPRQRVHLLHGAPRGDAASGASSTPRATCSSVLSLDHPADEREAAAFEYVHQTSLDPTGVTDEIRSRLAEHFTPEEVVEITLVVGFWKMYNTMHTAMGVPLEDPVLARGRVGGRSSPLGRLKSPAQVGH